MKIFLKSKENQFILTIIILLIINFSLGFAIYPDNLIFHEKDINPIFISSLIVSAYYGLRASIISALVFSFYYIMVLIKQTDFTVTESINTLHHLAIPLAMVFLSPLVGEIRQMSINKIKKLQLQIEQLNQKGQALFQGHEVQERELNEMKKKLLSKTETVANLYQDSKMFSTLNEEELIYNFLNVLQNITHVKSALFYKINYDQKQANHLIYTQIGESKGGDQLLNWDRPIIKLALNLKKAVSLVDLSHDEMGQEKEIYLVAPVFNNYQKLSFLLIVTEMDFIHYTTSNFKLIDIYTAWFSDGLRTIEQLYHSSELGPINIKWGTYTEKYMQNLLNRLTTINSNDNLHSQLIRFEINYSTPPTEDKKFYINKYFCESCLFHLDSFSYLHKVKNNNIFFILFIFSPIETVDKKIDDIKLSFEKDISAGSTVPKLTIEKVNFASQISNKGEYNFV